jgi:threonine/homoserine/homoserine lactone efflux protein
MTATLALLLMPGPAVLYIIARSIRQGRMAGFVSALGIGLAAIVHILFAAFGLSALLMQSAAIFGVIKYLGAAYLIYIGIRTLLSKAQAPDVESIQLMSYSQIFRQGFIVNLFNPKTALFFLSFLPQFVDRSRGSAILQIMILGTIFVSMAIISDSMYAMIAGTARELLSGSLKVVQIQKYIAGFIYIGLGISAAFTGNKSG